MIFEGAIFRGTTKALCLGFSWHQYRASKGNTNNVRLVRWDHSVTLIEYPRRDRHRPYLIFCLVHSVRLEALRFIFCE